MDARLISKQTIACCSSVVCRPDLFTFSHCAHTDICIQHGSERLSASFGCFKKKSTYSLFLACTTNKASSDNQKWPSWPCLQSCYRSFEKALRKRGAPLSGGAGEMPTGWPQGHICFNGDIVGGWENGSVLEKFCGHCLTQTRWSQD